MCLKIAYRGIVAKLVEIKDTLRGKSQTSNPNLKPNALRLPANMRSSVTHPVRKDRTKRYTLLDNFFFRHKIEWLCFV